MVNRIGLFICIATILLINVAPTVFIVATGVINATLTERLAIALVETYIPFLGWSLLFEVVRRRLPWKFLWKSIVFWGVSFPFIRVVRDLIIYGTNYWEYVSYAFPHLGVVLAYYPVQLVWGLGYGFLYYTIYGLIQTFVERRILKVTGVQSIPGELAPGQSS